MRRTFRLIAALVCSVFAASPATAQTYSFNNTAGGTWSTATNWTPAGGPPNSPTAIARMDLGSAAYTTSVDGQFNVLALQFGAGQTGNVAFSAGSVANPTITFNTGTGANGSIAANDGFTTLYVENGAAATYTLRPGFLFLGGGSAGNPVNHVWEIQGNRTVNIGSPTSGAGGTIQATDNSNNTITKEGTGTLVFNSNNFVTSGWTGGLIVNGGTVLANSTLALSGGFSTGTGSVTVNSGGTLGGKGQINLSAANSVTVNGGATLQAGTAAASPTLSITGGGGLTMNAASTLGVKLFGTGASEISRVTVTGAATVNTGKIDLDLSAISATQVNQLRSDVLAAGGSRSYRVMTASDSLTGFGFNQLGFTVTNLGSFAPGEWSFGTFDRNGDGIVAGFVTVNFTPVPEPHAVLALAGLASASFVAWRRKKRCPKTLS